jgi:hypothetical protein
MAVRVGRDLELVDDDAGRALHRRERVVALVGVRTDHDHQAGPFIDLPLKRTPDGQASVGALPCSLSVLEPDVKRWLRLCRGDGSG